MSKIKTSLGSKIFDSFNFTLLTIFGLAALVPFIYIILSSLTSTQEYLSKSFVFIPMRPSLEGYRYIFTTGVITRAVFNSIYITVVGTAFNLLFTTLLAYSLSKSYLVGRRFLMMYVIFPMVFSGGMIPTFLVVKGLGLINSLWALILVSLINPFNLIIIRNFFQKLPSELEDAARIDGCGDLSIFFRILLPLSKPVLATFTIFYAVGHWNGYFNALLYLNSVHLWPVQVWLRQVVITAGGQMGIGYMGDFGADHALPPTHVIKMGVIVVSTLPILVVYPFLQKHFVKGALLGSIKG